MADDAGLLPGPARLGQRTAALTSRAFARRAAHAPRAFPVGRFRVRVSPPARDAGLSLRQRFAHDLSPVRARAAPGSPCRRSVLTLLAVRGLRVVAARTGARRRTPPRPRRHAAAAAGAAHAPEGRRHRRATGTPARPTAPPASTSPSCPATSCSTTPTSRAASTPPGRRRSPRRAPATAFVKDGQFCIAVTNKGKDPWDAQMRHREMMIQKGHVYSIAFTAHATKPVQVKAKVGMSGPPYKEYWADTVDLTTHPQAFVGVFTMEEAEDPTAELAFHFGGDKAGETAGAVHGLLRRHAPRRPEVREGEEGGRRADPRVLVNQTGYLPALPKLATVKSASTTPLKWELMKQGRRGRREGRRPSRGQGRRLGRGRARRRLLVGTTPGQGLHAEGRQPTSHPFDIARGRVQEAEVRRARVLLSPAQRHRDRDAVRGRQAVDAPRRPRE